MSKTLVLLLVVSLAVNLAAVVTFSYYWWSEDRSAGRSGRALASRGSDVRPDLLRRRLQLTEEQLGAVGREREEMMRQMMSIRRQSSNKRRELMELLEEAELDRGRADSLLEEIAALQVRIERLTFEHLAKMRQLLTPQQQEHLLRMLERRLPHGGNGHPLLEERMERRMKDRPRHGERHGGDNGE
jgi:Spy/CpxP family protein refolding chaperone